MILDSGSLFWPPCICCISVRQVHHTQVLQRWGHDPVPGHWVLPQGEELADRPLSNPESPDDVNTRPAVHHWPEWTRGQSADQRWSILGVCQWRRRTVVDDERFSVNLQKSGNQRRSENTWKNNSVDCLSTNVRYPATDWLFKPAALAN